MFGARLLREENGIWGRSWDVGVHGEDAGAWGKDFGIIVGFLDDAGIWDAEQGW